MRKLTQQDTDFIIANRSGYTFGNMAKRLGYNNKTLKKLIQPLIKDGLITAWPYGGSKKGRAYNPMRKIAKPMPIELTKEERIERLRMYAGMIPNGDSGQLLKQFTNRENEESYKLRLGIATELRNKITASNSE